MVTLSSRLKIQISKFKKRNCRAQQPSLQPRARFRLKSSGSVCARSFPVMEVRGRGMGVCQPCSLSCPLLKDVQLPLPISDI